MSNDGALGSDRIKHLEFIQAIIARLANNSFLVRGWTITIAAAFFAVLANKPNALIAAVLLLPIAAFWVLDGYFLWQERLFRRLYDAVRRPDSDVEPMSLNVRPYVKACTWRGASLSPTVLLYSMPLVVLDILAIITISVR